MPEEIDPNLWQRTYDHFKDGYKNAQEAIRFVDTKTAVITGLIMLTTAMPFGVLKWSAGLDGKDPANLENFQLSHFYAYQIILGGCMLGILFGICGVAFGIEGLAPRSPKKYYQGFPGMISRWKDITLGHHKSKNDRPRVTVLFPFYKEKDEVVAAKYFHESSKGLTEKQILQEYEIQIKQVGRIICLKIECNQRSAICFRWQLWIYLATSILAFIAVSYYSL